MSTITSLEAQRIDLDNGRFGCTLCETTISRKGDFKRHALTHSKHKVEVSYKCSHPKCDFVTLQKSNLRTHEDTQ
jgi:hypothetical protein